MASMCRAVYCYDNILRLSKNLPPQNYSTDLLPKTYYGAPFVLNMTFVLLSLVNLVSKKAKFLESVF